ncbi:hypothetical protein [Thermacetogenium phaeum]|uniref:hypothetical protein n=1 Tax=Thermacetogenium phaeum TaxID=85874 RepID=UPI00048DD119|nr:hypothetical protein [Thermacetogenium phaeum]
MPAVKGIETAAGRGQARGQRERLLAPQGIKGIGQRSQCSGAGSAGQRVLDLPRMLKKIEQGIARQREPA